MNALNSLEILYVDNHLLVINKPSGLLSQGDQTGDKPLIEYCKDYIKKKYNKPGAVFLGLNGVAVKSHGGTDAFGFANAICVAM